MLCQRDGRRNTGTQRAEWVWDAGAGASSPSALRTSQGPSCCFQPAWVPQAQHDPAGSSSTWSSHTGLTPRCGSTWMQSPSDAAWGRDLRPGVPGAEELPVLCCWEPGGEAAPFLPRGCSVWRKLRRAPGPHLTGVHVARIHLQTPSKRGYFHPPSSPCPTLTAAPSSSHRWVLNVTAKGPSVFPVRTRMHGEGSDPGIACPSASLRVDVRSGCGRPRNTERGQHPISHVAHPSGSPDGTS